MAKEIVIQQVKVFPLIVSGDETDIFIRHRETSPLVVERSNVPRLISALCELSGVSGVPTDVDVDKVFPMTFYDGTLTLDDKLFDVKRRAVKMFLSEHIAPLVARLQAENEELKKRIEACEDQIDTDKSTIELLHHNNAKLSASQGAAAALIKVGDYVKGSWRDSATGKTYYSEGTVKQFPAGIFVQQDEEGGITPLSDFFHFSEIITEKENNTQKEIASLRAKLDARDDVIALLRAQLKSKGGKAHEYEKQWTCEPIPFTDNYEVKRPDGSTLGMNGTARHFFDKDVAQEITSNFNALLSATARVAELEAQLLKINNATLHADQGRDGCKYGDTDYESVSVAYGYNLLREEIQSILTPPQNTKGDDRTN